ncbi:MAG: hypothetical protein JRJ51_26115 [Deltaproteobacteria bacterium]|nr:hypothetical protein [Deltaproteobacteria bacterium]
MKSPLRLLSLDQPSTFHEWQTAESGEEHGLTAAEITKKILRGKKAGDFPIRTAKKGKVTINLKTAQKLGIDIPAYIVQSAQHIIE